MHWNVFLQKVKSYQNAATLNVVSGPSSFFDLQFEPDLVNIENIIKYYYSTIVSFHQTRSRERAKYATEIHWSVPVWPVYNRANTDKDISLAFCGVCSLLRNSQNIRVYYMQNHRLRCIYITVSFNEKVHFIQQNTSLLSGHTWQQLTIKKSTFGVMM